MAIAILITTMALTPMSRSRVLSVTNTITTTAATAIHTAWLTRASNARGRDLRAVGLSLAILALAAGAQLAIFIASGSIALLADLIHNFGDASTAIPLGAAFLLRSARAERWEGLA
jgi:Co/Zn/Cd efflux system component